ncbi:MAG: outer membrane protein transport protein [Acidobacteriota bacterium]|nr:MAG: outer membrane protein transport protein [Acidobacteriota bacterium]
MRSKRLARQLAVALVFSLAGVAVPVFAGGFEIYTHGAKATGLGGAFSAQADDPSAIFYNPAGLAFQRERSFLAGVSSISLGDTDFRGLPPFPDSSASGTRLDRIVHAPHLYALWPLGERLTIGLGINTPFLFSTEWENPDAWAGRFIATKAELNAVDLVPTVGVRVSDSFSIGVGIAARAASVELQRRLAIPDPFGNTGIVEFARLVMETDSDVDVGFNVGLLYRPTETFSVGLTYRSPIDVKLDGYGRLTQIPTGNPELDLLLVVPGSPFEQPFDVDLPMTTSFDFPDSLSLGIAYRFNDDVIAEVDFNWTGWGRFDRITTEFPEYPEQDFVRVENWVDVWHYRIGVNWSLNSSNEIRWGFIYDQSPQPDESIGPIIQDADRRGFTFGYGRVGQHVNFDLALEYAPYQKRTPSVSNNNFFGTYETSTWLLAASLGF